ncbi:MAG: Lpg1974 family pore-forming outer membrane protein, partial [Planctomycetia bacterium]
MAEHETHEAHDAHSELPHLEEHGFRKGGLFFTGDWLLWKPRRRALDFAIVDGSANGRPNGTVESADWETASGFRFGAGYRVGGEEWTVGGVYTYFHSDDQRGLAAPAGGTLYTTLTSPAIIEEATSADAGTNLDYDVVDLEVTRHFEPGECLKVWLTGGGRFAWIDQNLSVLYNGADADNAYVQSDINFDGAGLRVGGGGQYAIGMGLNVYGSAYGSLLAGDFRTNLLETNSSGTATNVDVREKYYTVVPVAEMAFGLGYERGNMHLKLGYEITNWFNMVDSIDFTDDLHEGKPSRRLSDLSLDGLTLRLGL